MKRKCYPKPIYDWMVINNVTSYVDLARKLNTSKEAIWNWVHKGSIPSAKLRKAFKSVNLNIYSFLKALDDSVVIKREDFDKPVSVHDSKQEYMGAKF